MIRRVALAAMASAAAEVAGVGLMATAAWLLLRAAEHPPLGALAVAIVVVRTLAIGRGGLRYAERLVGHKVVLEHVSELRGRIFDAAARGGARSDGDSLSRLVSDVDAVQDALLRCLVPWTTAGVVGVAAAVGAFVVEVWAGVLVVVGGVVLCGVAVGLARSRDAGGPVLRARLAGEVADLVYGSADLAAFGAGGRYRERAVATSARIEEVDRRSDGAVSAVVGVVGAVVALGAGLLSADAGLPVAAAVTLGLIAVFDVALPAVTAARGWPQHRAALERLRELLNAPPPAQGPTEPLPRARVVALVGPSGSGKTTLLRRIAAGLDPAVVRGVFADDHVFTATLRDNVLLGTDAVPHEPVLTPWLATLPDGWDTELTADALSGGQRARLLLARALTAAPDVLLLDEPVEGLDPATADALMHTLLAYPGHVIVATHRLAALPTADEILVLHNGKITQRGPHATLVAQPGYYRDRWLTERALDELARPASAVDRQPAR